MAWMSDEKYTYIQDCKDKKITARSAMNKRTHCGKSGRVRLPSDNLTKKELQAMNGECKSYRLNEPMGWKEFKEMPDDLKEMYILALREKFNVPDSYIAEMLGVSHSSLQKYTKALGLTRGRNYKGSHKWDKAPFFAWAYGTDINPETEVKETETMEDLEQYTADKVEPAESTNATLAHSYDDSESTQGYDDPTICTSHYMPVIPKSGTMTFEHNNADEALATIRCLLDNVKVNITVSWECVGE